MTARARMFVVFFVVVLSLYTLLTAYVFWHLREIVPAGYLTLFTVLYVIIAYAFILGRVLERVMLNWISAAFVFVGAYWLGAMVYFVLTLAAIDLARLASALIPVLPSMDSVSGLNRTLYLAAAAVVLLLLVSGTLNARHVRVRKLQIKIARPTVQSPPFSIAVASDIHLGTIINRGRIEKIVASLNALDADLVLLVGDVVDEDLAPVIKQNLGEVLRTIRSRYGVYAVTGNHEYIGGVEDAVHYLRAHGITVLRDEVVTIDGRVTLVGREDVMSGRFANRRRKPLSELLAGVDRSLPIILLDHQPFRLHEAETHGIDLQLSGHTHHGQLWPFNYITRRVYEVSWGYLRRGATHYYVSSGVGTWGPPMKIGSHAEVVSIMVTTA